MWQSLITYYAFIKASKALYPGLSSSPTESSAQITRQPEDEVSGNGEGPVIAGLSLGIPNTVIRLKGKAVRANAACHHWL